MNIMQCNIDAMGKAVRLRLGILAVIAGGLISVGFILLNFNFGVEWIIPLGIIAGGAFSMFEGWAGWCVVRAIGIKTPH
ncbi:MAG: hypothetical protein CBC45_001220 [Euryarchaeota archaeon TMED85]|nr:MAG: hypothetical protein CBC45_001220 [Euryarchaeota archaeon TMED85]